MTGICIICARGGSKGVPRKNIRDFMGKPLIHWTINAALISGTFDCVAVSSDSPEILDAARSSGAHILIDRPAALASDQVSVLPAVQHGLQTCEAQLGRIDDHFVLLQPTTPLRTAEDIKGALENYRKAPCQSVVSVVAANKSPYFSLVEEQPDGTVALSKSIDTVHATRQSAPKVYALNGAIYVWNRASFIEDPKVIYPDTRAYEMPQSHSVDIDTEEDWTLAEIFFKARNQGV